MGLSGTLEAFPLSEVLRLLARSGQTGRLYAQSGVMEMRAYLLSGTLAVAWAGTDEALGDELVARGLFREGSWVDVARGNLTLESSLNEGVTEADFEKAVLDITTEGLAKMVDGRAGTFAFEEGNTEGLVLETGLDLDTVLTGVDERLRTWRRLRSIVPDTSRQLTFRLAVPGQTVEMSHTAWNLLVSVLPSKSLDALVERTGRSSTAVVEEIIELLESGHAEIEGYVSPSLLEPEIEEPESDPDITPPAGTETDYLAYVGDDPLGGSGPVGWENDILSIPASDDDADEEEAIPLMSVDEAPFLADGSDGPAGFDFGLVGFDVAPSKGRNLLEKDESWDVFSDLLRVDPAKAEAEMNVRPYDPESEDDSEPDPAESASEVDDPAADGAFPEADLGLALNQLVEVVAEDDSAPDSSEAEPVVDERPGEEPVEMAATEDAEVSVEADADGELGALASILSRLELDDTAPVPSGSDAPDGTDSWDALPYDDSGPEDEPGSGGDQDQSAEDGAADEEAEEEDLQRSLPNLLRRRSRGALARELRSLSD